MIPWSERSNPTLTRSILEMKPLRQLASLITIACAMCLVAFHDAAASICTHFASPSGKGNGASASTPFLIADFWSVAQPGHTLCLLDGQYTGAASMINPPQNLSGTPLKPITVKAFNDGKVTINGNGTLTPVRLYYNNYFVLEGFNAGKSNATVVHLNQSNHVEVRRVAAWDAADNNTNIFGVHGGDHTLLEDVAGWGVARKIFSASQGGDYTTIRRAWGRWEGSHVVGPKMTYTLAYNNYNMTCENCIGTWSGERLKETYTLLDYYGKPWTGKGAGTFDNYYVDQAYGIFGIDGLGNNSKAETMLLGSIAYITETDRFAPNRTIFVTKVDSFEIRDTVAYVQPGTHPSVKPLSLNNLGATPATKLIASRITSIGSSPSAFGSDWQKSNILEATSLSQLPMPFITPTATTNICYRYKNRMLTAEPLWPWPMNSRIKAAMLESGRAPVDVTATIERIFGSIPSHCKASDVSQPTASGIRPPSAPSNLALKD